MDDRLSIYSYGGQSRSSYGGPSRNSAFIPTTYPSLFPSDLKLVPEDPQFDRYQS